MSDKRDKKKNTSKKVTKNKTISMLKLDNDVEIPAMTIFMKDSKYFNINNIDISKIRVSNAKVFMKENNSYKYYIFYEDGDKYIPLNICFSKTLAGYYNDKEFEFDDGNVSKTMSFMIDDDLKDRINEIPKHIEEKLNIALQDPIHKSEINHYFRTKRYKRTRFNKKGCRDIHIVPNENTKYECKPLLQIQSIYYAQEDKKHIFCYPQIRLEHVDTKILLNRKLLTRMLCLQIASPNRKKSSVMIMMTEMNNHTLIF